MLDNRSTNPIVVTDADFEARDASTDQGGWETTTFNPPARHVLPKSWSSFMTPATGWRSPSLEGGITATLAWRWLQAWVAKHRAQGIDALQCCWSSWASHHEVVDHTSSRQCYVVLHSTRFGVLGWRVTAEVDLTHNCTYFHLEKEGMPFESVFMYDPDSWLVWRVRACPPILQVLEGGQTHRADVCLEAMAVPDTFLRHIFRHGASCPTKNRLTQLLSARGLPTQGLKNVLPKRFLRHEFPELTDEAVDAMMDKSSKAWLMQLS